MCLFNSTNEWLTTSSHSVPALYCVYFQFKGHVRRPFNTFVYPLLWTFSRVSMWKFLNYFASGENFNFHARIFQLSCITFFHCIAFFLWSLFALNIRIHFSSSRWQKYKKASAPRVWYTCRVIDSYRCTLGYLIFDYDLWVLTLEGGKRWYQIYNSY
jgi:hypothetical protein